MVPPREFHKGRGRLGTASTASPGDSGAKQNLGREQCRGATRRDRRDPDSQPNLASGLFRGEKDQAVPQRRYWSTCSWRPCVVRLTPWASPAPAKGG
jgi:hypothetical protein